MRTIYQHIRSLRHLRSSTSEDVAEIACALVDSCLDCSNSVLHGATNKIFSEPHKAENHLTRVVTIAS